MLISTRIKIDGTDITELFAYQGVQWKRNDIDGPNAGRTLSGLMIRDRVATKIRLDITCRILNREEVRTLLNLLMPEFVSVTYDDPMDGVVTRTMYANNNEAKFLRSLDNDSDELWDNVTFPLVER
jgi:hypothetical protein